ncbi:lamin tail domain-containing protein [Streptomyces sp. NBC_01201]|uniref:lamin tail domain-containing protein n=1 Tax=unclassified Streptomyces TaxID=2593676 RepID=UPI002E0E38B4|nr:MULTISPECIES: lamin tail domain-containing protein [unclassified Streptomyces]WSR06363.1 lamin tail domain-containing protein [Streptomyces sp. NBC_01208]WSR51029.1 lamin tail domain-containing protein [Streptomyces sp. NBC_01201]
MRIRTAAPLALAAATALAGSLLASAPASAASHQGGLHLGKIQYDSPGKDTRTNTSLNAEYVDIHNNGRSKLQLRGYKLKDDTGYTYTFPSFTVAAGKTVRVHTGKGGNSAAHVYWNRGSYVWNNTGDKARLIKPSGTLLDSCSWGRGNGVKVCH